MVWFGFPRSLLMTEMLTDFISRRLTSLRVTAPSSLGPTNYLLLTKRKEGESGRAKFLTLNAQQLKLEAIPVLIKI